MNEFVKLSLHNYKDLLNKEKQLEEYTQNKRVFVNFKVSWYPSEIIGEVSSKNSLPKEFKELIEEQLKIYDKYHKIYWENKRKIENLRKKLPKFIWKFLKLNEI